MLLTEHPVSIATFGLVIGYLFDFEEDAVLSA